MQEWNFTRAHKQLEREIAKLKTDLNNCKKIALQCSLDLGGKITISLHPAAQYPFQVPAENFMETEGGKYILKVTGIVKSVDSNFVEMTDIGKAPDRLRKISLGDIRSIIAGV